MKNLRFIFILLILSSTAVLNTGCEFVEALIETVEKCGCTDSEAINYDSTAEIDDGTCEYLGEIIFWYGKSDAASLLANNVSYLKYYVDGKFVGSSSTRFYWTSAPTCGSSSAVTVSDFIKGKKFKECSYKITNGNGIAIWEGTITFWAGSCTPYRLTFYDKK